MNSASQFTTLCHRTGLSKEEMASHFTTLCHRTGLSKADLARRLNLEPVILGRYQRGREIPKQRTVDALNDLLQQRGSNRLCKDDEPPKFRFIDLFAGIGGLRRGFEDLGGKCIFTSEWNPFSRHTYAANYFWDEHLIHGDITKVKKANIPKKFELLLAGFPCQPFSLAGVSKKNSLGRAHGFEDETQGTLFFDIVRILKERSPQAFLLENVKNLKSHDGGKTIRVIMDTLNKLNYNVFDPITIDAKGLVPQHRERMFIIGFRKKNDFKIEDILQSLPDKANGPKLATILHPEDGSEEGDPPYTDENGLVDSRYILSDKLWNYLQDYAAKHRAKGNGFGFGLVGPEDSSRTLSARYYKDGAEILVKRKEGNPRRLTPRECSRLMGFDEPGGKAFKIPVSDAQAYRQFGNAVVVPVARQIAEHMVHHLRLKK